MFKKSIFGAISAIALLVLLGACTPQQSELRLDSVTQTGKIEGKVTYDVGVYKDDAGNIITYGGKFEPADGVTVIARIAHSQYVSGSNTGDYTVEATTDRDGRYELNIPTGAKTVSVKVSCLPFYKRKGYLKEGKIEYEVVLYNNSSSQNPSITAKEIKVVNLQVTSPY